MADLPFEQVSEIEDAAGPVGQDRAVEAVEFAIAMRRKGYNVYALGDSGTGKHRVIADLLQRRAKTAPPDWCYANNFVDPQKPNRLQLPPGRAVGLREAMNRLVEELRVALPAAFERRNPISMLQYSSCCISVHQAAATCPKFSAAPAACPSPGRDTPNGSCRVGVYIAPPDQHMLLAQGYVGTVHGAKENHTRPAVDPLFRRSH